MFWVYGDNVVKRGFPMVGTIIIAINILIYLLMAGLWREDLEAMPQDVRYILTEIPHSESELDAWRKKYWDWRRNTKYERFSEKWGAKASHLRQGHVMCLVTYMFIHGGFFHIFGNMLMLWALLGTLEITLGQVRFLFCYLLWGVAAGLAHVGMEWQSDMGLVGASGAIAGMVGAYVVAFGALTKIRVVIFLGVKAIHFMIPTGVYVLLWVLSQLAGMEEESKYGGTGIAWYCHAGGFALGIATMLLFRRRVLSQMIRNKAGDLQALDEEEREKYEKDLAAKAAMAATLPEEEAEEDGPAEFPEDEEETVPGRSGIRPWQVILGISGLLLLAAVFLATRKETPDEKMTVVRSKDKDPKPVPEYKFKGKPLSSYMAELIGDDRDKRRAVAEKLGTIDADGAAQLAPRLAPLLKDDDPDVRQLSAYVLSNIKSDPDQAEVVEALDGALRDKAKTVRRYASMAFVQMGQSKPEKLAPVLKAALADADPDVRRLGRYIHEQIDPDGTRTASLNVKVDLRAAREGFRTVRIDPKDKFKPTGAPARPPAEVFTFVRYPSPAGELGAYLTPDAGDGMKRPAVLWAHGGLNGIGSYLWQARARSNDQTASAFRAAGCILMCPSWRNENDNPGKFSLFYGELDDLLAARDYLARLPYVDPERIYLAGHDTGGTLALLAATASDKFRAIFSFGGAPDMQNLMLAGAYGNTPFDATSAAEVRLRSATLFAVAIRRPTFYFGGDDNSFGQDARVMEERAKKGAAPFQVFIVKEGTHYDILDPITRLVARKILNDKGDTCNITFTADEVKTAFAKRKK